MKVVWYTGKCTGTYSWLGHKLHALSCLSYSQLQWGLFWQTLRFWKEKGIQLQENDKNYILESFIWVLLNCQGKSCSHWDRSWPKAQAKLSNTLWQYHYFSDCGWSKSEILWKTSENILFSQNIAQNVDWLHNS